MAAASLATLIKLLGDSASKRNDKSKWSAEFVNIESEDKEQAKVDSVKLEATGLVLELSRNGKKTKIEARPASAKKTKVIVDGDRDPEASLVFDFKGNILNPTRWAFDFRPVTVDDEEFRINTRFDP